MNRLAKTQHFPDSWINSAHQGRWPDFPSRLNGSYIGYNAIIDRYGVLRQYRYVGEETAASVGSNSNTIHICLAGNFTEGVEEPTEAQKKTLRGVLAALLNPGALRTLETLPGTRVGLSRDRIYPHRMLHPGHTECYGTSLSDDWVKSLLDSPTESPPVEEQITALTLSIQKLMDRIREILGPKAFGGVPQIRCGVAMRG